MDTSGADIQTKMGQLQYNSYMQGVNISTSNQTLSSLARGN